MCEAMLWTKACPFPVLHISILDYCSAGAGHENRFRYARRSLFDFAFRDSPTPTQRFLCRRLDFKKDTNLHILVTFQLQSPNL